ncbi:hypothetical protein PAMP_020249 [Pampus punctatissimus]
MLKISILKLENPSCIWGRVDRGPSGDEETTEQYENLFAQMNLFYRNVTQDLRNLKPMSLDEGQVCVVYWSVMKSWCRAVVESIITDSVSCHARCLLVDHGELLVVPSDQIRVAVQNFLQLPFWVRRFHLAGIKPTTLRVSVYEEKAELIPSSQWDSSATLYLHKLLQASTETDAVLLKSESDSTSIELYLTVRNIKICVNDELVVKKFAYYGDSANSSGLHEVDRSPIMLSSSILTQIVSTTSMKLTAETPLCPGKHTDVTSCSRLLRCETYTDSGADSGSTTPGAHHKCFKSQQHELKTCEEGSVSTVTGRRFPGSQSKNSSDSAAAERFLNPRSSYQQVAPSISQQEELKVCRPEETTAASSSRAAQDVYATHMQHTAQDVYATHMQHTAQDVYATHMQPRSTGRVRYTHAAHSTGRVRYTHAAHSTGRVVPSDPRISGILVHSAFPVEPCTSLDDAPITDSLRWVLRRMTYCSLSPADCHSWPSVARGCNTVIVSHSADQPLSYLAPLLTHILLNSIFASLTSSTAGPIAVLLCPGWEKVQALYDLLEESKVTQALHPVIMLLGTGKDEAKSVRIPKNCLLVVTTPFSLVRLLLCHSFLFLRLYHLILDEADRLFTLAPDQMATILQHFQKVTSREENASCPQQLIAVARRWTSHMEDLIANHMPCPCIVMTVAEEASLYGNVQQIVLMTLENNKISVLLGALDFNPDIGQKTLIVANSAEEVEDVFKAVSNQSAFCLKTHEGLTYQIDFVVQQWKKDMGPRTHVILVTTNECLRCLGIRDATCVVHYGFPSSPKLFGSRLFCMAENFRNLSERDQIESCPHVTRSVLLISERNARHVTGVLRYLGRTNALLPPELLSFARGVHVAREDQKTNRPLCSYLKSFGVCRKEDCGYDNMVSEMASYYNNKKPGAKEVLEGGLYAVQEDDVFHRVKVLCVPDRGERLFFTVFVQFIDMGKKEEVKSHQILQLPEQFHTLPEQAVEIIVSRVKPVDAETDWHPKVRVKQVPGMKTVINEYNVQSVILNTGMGVENPEHLDLLRALCQEGVDGCSKEAGHISRLGDGSASLDVRIKAEEEVLAEAFRAAEIEKLAAPDPPRLKTYEPLSPISSLNQFLVPAYPANEVQTVSVHDQKSLSDIQAVDEQRSIQTAGSESAVQMTSFHPQVRWYQTSDSVIVTVKLTNPENQRCDFYPDRVIYRVSGRTYRADLQLQSNITAERCCWEMKSNEPVLKLVKLQQGCWERLLRTKNIFVRYDTEHIEDDEDRAPNCKKHRKKSQKT